MSYLKPEDPNYIDAEDTFFVLFAAIFTSLLSEGTAIIKTILSIPIGISWLLIYRHKDY